MDLKIYAPEELSGAPVKLPLSKSESNRQLIIAALTPGAELPRDVAKCDDTDALLAALDRTDGVVNIGAAGTAMRFLTAYYACRPGTDVLLDGSERMRQRPIGPLVEALRTLGCDIEYVGEQGFPPLHIRGCQPKGGTVEMDATVSSQYVSALMMVAPLMEQGMSLRLIGDIVSRPYIRMTESLMKAAGIGVMFDEPEGLVEIPRGTYEPGLPPVEADWSAASYWLEIAAISCEPVQLLGLRPKSLQGDSEVTRLFQPTGLRCGFEEEGSLLCELTPDAYDKLHMDFSDTPDLAQTMAVTCCVLGIPFLFTGLQSLRIKETDRLAAMQMELSKLGFVTDVTPDGGFVWTGARFDPGEQIEPIATYQDHRMAMAFAPAAIFFPGLQINDAEVVSKSYPGFWDDLRAQGFVLEEVSNDD